MRIQLLPGRTHLTSRPRPVTPMAASQHVLTSAAPPPTAADLPGEAAAYVITPCPRRRPQGWQTAHARHVKDAETSKAQSTAFDLLLFGDSITEHLRGTQHGKEDSRYQDNKQAWNEVVESKYRTVVHSIGGDMSHNLLWRLRNGSGPSGLSVRVVAVLIGSNDLAQLLGVYNGDPDRDPAGSRPNLDPLEHPAWAAAAAFARVRLVLDELAAQAPQAHLLVLGLPPLQPGWCEGEQQQHRVQALADGVNALLQQYVAEQQAQQPAAAPGEPEQQQAQQAQRRVVYVDCTTPFLESPESWKVNRLLIPDGLHPSPPRSRRGEPPPRGGGWVLAECVLRGMQEVLGEGGG